MSAHDQSVRPDDASIPDEFSLDKSNVNGQLRSSSTIEAYYELLVGRLEVLLLDMKQNGMSSNDPLFGRLQSLLVETRGLLRHTPSVAPVSEGEASVSDR